MTPASLPRAAPSASSPLDLTAIRADFPALGRRVHRRRLVYLDNAATTQKPRAVLAALRRHYVRDNGNVRRAAHTLGARATAAYERAREVVARFLGAEPGEIVFTRGTTESINLVAASYARSRLRAGDEVLVTEMEHHANIVPWQMACRATGARLRVAAVDVHGVLDRGSFAAALGARTKIVALAHASNALGTVNPVAELTRLAQRAGAVVVVDGAQAVPHLAVDVRAIGCDFYACSGHKLYGPTGVGVLYGRKSLLAEMPPWQGGGEMVRSVTWDDAVYDDPPHRFEAGTPAVAEAVGLAAALTYLTHLGRDAIARHEADVLALAAAELARVPGLRLIGTAPEKVGGHSFVLDGIHAHDVATILDGEGIAVRAGHHCAQPLLRRFGVPATVRASFALYNGADDVARLVEALAVVRRRLA